MLVPAAANGSAILANTASICAANVSSASLPREPIWPETYSVLVSPLTIVATWVYPEVELINSLSPRCFQLPMPTSLSKQYGNSEPQATLTSNLNVKLCSRYLWLSSLCLYALPLHITKFHFSMLLKNAQSCQDIVGVVCDCCASQ